MKPTIFNKATLLWKQASAGTSPQYSNFDPEIKERVSSIFQVGDFYHWIFNLREIKFDFMSDTVEDILGYTPKEMDVPTLINNIHPEDHQWFLKFESKVVEFFTGLPPEHVQDYKIRFDYRLKKKYGGYVRVLHQVIAIDFDGKGGFFRTFGVHTDITHLKPDGQPMLSFIGLNGRPSFIDVKVELSHEHASLVANKSECLLSLRELEVLSLIANGKNRSQIADALFISPETVKSHRKNLLSKAGVKNTAHLIQKAVREGWI